MYKEKKLYSTTKLQHLMLQGIKGHIGNSVVAHRPSSKTSTASLNYYMIKSIRLVKYPILNRLRYFLLKQ